MGSTGALITARPMSLTTEGGDGADAAMNALHGTASVLEACPCAQVLSMNEPRLAATTTDDGPTPRARPLGVNSPAPTRGEPTATGRAAPADLRPSNATSLPSMRNTTSTTPYGASRCARTSPMSLCTRGELRPFLRIASPNASNQPRCKASAGFDCYADGYRASALAS